MVVRLKQEVECRCGQTLSVKDLIGDILSFWGHAASVAATALCGCSVKAARDNTQTNEPGCVLFTLFTGPVREPHESRGCISYVLLFITKNYMMLLMSVPITIQLMHIYKLVYRP